MDNGYPAGPVRMRVALGRCAMRRPSCVADPDSSGKRLIGNRLFKIVKLALGPSALGRATIQRCHPSRIVAAIFKPLQSVNNWSGNRPVRDHSDDAAHLSDVLSVKFSQN